MKQFCLRGHDTIICGRSEANQCRQCSRDYRTRIGKTKYDLIHKDQHLKALYGIDLQEYNRLFQIQGGSCKICKRHQSIFKKALAVDHNHKTGKIRGLLCKDCNTGLGNFQENQSILQIAITYLEDK